MTDNVSNTVPTVKEQTARQSVVWTAGRFVLSEVCRRITDEFALSDLRSGASRSLLVAQVHPGHDNRSVHDQVRRRARHILVSVVNEEVDKQIDGRCGAVERGNRRSVDALGRGRASGSLRSRRGRDNVLL